MKKWLTILFLWYIIISQATNSCLRIVADCIRAGLIVTNYLFCHDIQGIACAVNKIRHSPQCVTLFFKSSYLLNRVNVFLLRKQSPPPTGAICSPQLHYSRKERRGNVGENTSNNCGYFIFCFDTWMGNDLYRIESNFAIHESKKICPTQLGRAEEVV